jgi:hypothetical protein
MIKISMLIKHVAYTLFAVIKRQDRKPKKQRILLLKIDYYFN